MPFLFSQADVQLSKEAQNVLHIAGRKAEEYLHASYGAPHLLWALLNKQVSTYSLVRDLGKDIFYLQEWASVRLEEYPKANIAVSDAAAAEELAVLLKEADQQRFELELEDEEVEAACLLAVICIPGLVFSYDQLKTFSLSKDEVLQGAYGDALPGNGYDAGNGPLLSKNVQSSDSGSDLGQYCIDKQREVAARKHFKLVERKEEINTCLEVLSRYAKANLIISGEPGVGKTALINGLTERLDKENILENLRNARLLELDMAALQAGASYKGELEDRFQKIITELKKLEKPILVIENIHALLNEPKNISSLASLLLMELNRGQLTVVGTTTPENYHKTIEKNETFTRRFETLTLEEPGDKETAAIIRTVITPHENHHNLHISDDTIEEAIRLSKRYDKERRLPDAAIDLIDRCMARVRISVNRSRALFEELKEAFRQYENREHENEEAKSEEMLDALEQFENVEIESADVRNKYAAFVEAAEGLLKNHYGFTLKQYELAGVDTHDILPSVPNSTGNENDEIVPLEGALLTKNDKMEGEENEIERSVLNLPEENESKITMLESASVEKVEGRVDDANEIESSEGSSSEEYGKPEDGNNGMKALEPLPSEGNLKMDDGKNRMELFELSPIKKHNRYGRVPSEPNSLKDDEEIENKKNDVVLSKSVSSGNDFEHSLNELISRLDALHWDESLPVVHSDLAAIISRKTGIPTGKIQTQERKRLLGMEEVLRERVVGQDGALESISEAVLESRSGLMKDGQPIGSFFFLGPTGTGKTELAKALSEFLFQDEQAMIRFDMSEFKEEHSAALLHGAPPGYVGYEEGGMLVNKIREKPYSVVLFDEIEKAHPSVFDIFLQILDEGKLNDRFGKEGDFSNAVILFTSNIASEHISKVFEEKGRLPSSQNLMEQMSGHFRPEFLGRLTEIVPFAPISEDVLLRIFEIHLAELLMAAIHKGVSVEIDAETKTHLAQMGYSTQYGARPLKGVIRDKIRRPLSRMLIEGRIESGSSAKLSLDNDNELQWNIN